MRAGAKKSTDRIEIINRYCKVGITRWILRSVNVVAKWRIMRIMRYHGQKFDEIGYRRDQNRLAVEVAVSR